MARKWSIRLPSCLRCLRCLICVRRTFKVTSAPKLSDFLHPPSVSTPVPHTKGDGKVAPNGRISQKSRGAEDHNSSVSMTCMTVEHKPNRPLEEYVFPRTLGHEEEEEEREEGGREVRMTA